MKRAILATLLALSVTAVWATDRGNPMQPSPTTINAPVGLGLGVGVGVGGAGGVGNGGSAVLNNSYHSEAPDYGDLRIVPPAIAPNINTNIICPMVMQGSKAGSVFFFSGSGTHKPDIVAICVAWHLGQTKVVERMTCDADPAYRKANPNCEAQ